jgi:cell division protein FtsA
MQAENQELHVGLEIGTTKICMCVSEERIDGTLRILGLAEVPSRGVRKGEIVDPDVVETCIFNLIFKAQQFSGGAIRKVSVALTGHLLKSIIWRTMLIVPKGSQEVSQQDWAEVEDMAQNPLLPSDRLILQVIPGADAQAHPQKQYADPDELVDFGAAGEVQETLLAAETHVIHGNKRRIERTLACLETLKLEVVNLIPSSIASATALLGKRAKSVGVLVIDLGGGTTDYCIALGGKVRFTGMLPVGGDHITNDLSIGLRIPIAKTEILKIKEGSASANRDVGIDIIKLNKGSELPDYEIDRSSLDTIIHHRASEIFELIRDDIASVEGTVLLQQLTEVVLTGGSSKLKGLTEVAVGVFELPVKLGHAQSMSGTNQIIENPAFTTVIGLTKYASENISNSPTPVNSVKHLIGLYPFKKKEFKTAEEYLLALQQERESRKGHAENTPEDLDIPTFLRIGTGVKMNPSIQLP